MIGVGLGYGWGAILRPSSPNETNDYQAIIWLWGTKGAIFFVSRVYARVRESSSHHKT